MMWGEMGACSSIRSGTRSVALFVLHFVGAYVLIRCAYVFGEGRGRRGQVRRAFRLAMCGCIRVWACRRVGVWAYGRMGVWACGRMGVAYRCVGLFLLLCVCGCVCE